ncbi:MAG: glycosyltransferase [Crocinitomicaceae bacterium]|nr:glycosyltransferase [Crocinitomicaceae bacterium]|tara:strand:- start:41823 stop:42983 length:1161 start_codon:yes stop_codon:yes gene_type:complete
MSSEVHSCILIPTYNNENTLCDVVDRVINILPDYTLIIVNDGSTDSTFEKLSSYGTKIDLISYTQNKGKGYALKLGFKRALILGFDNVITIDSDNQHFPEDIPLLLSESKKHPGKLIIGNRDMNQKGIPGKSSFGNKFSNFWFKLETWVSLSDTQSGFRLYPLKPINNMRFFSKKFEFEIEVIVRLAWKNVGFRSVPVRVNYNIKDRVSHFRPMHDFLRISVLNSILVLIAILYFYPKRLFSLNTIKLIKTEAIKPDESNFSKAFSIGFGVFFGVLPIWGFQLIIGIPIAILFRLNKVLFITAANISIPPVIPFIIYASFLMGQQVISGEINHDAIFSYSLEDIQNNVVQYVVGAIILSIVLFIITFLFSFIFLKIFRKEPRDLRL